MQQAFLPFGAKHKGFSIRFDLLGESELSVIESLRAHANYYFPSEFDQTKVKDRSLCRFIWNRNDTINLFPLSWRRQILANFQVMVMSKIPMYRMHLYVVLQRIGMERADSYCIILSEIIVRVIIANPLDVPTTHTQS